MVGGVCLILDPGNVMDSKEWTIIVAAGNVCIGAGNCKVVGPTTGLTGRECCTRPGGRGRDRRRWIDANCTTIRRSDGLARTVRVLRGRYRVQLFQVANQPDVGSFAPYIRNSHDAVAGEFVLKV